MPALPDLLPVLSFEEILKANITRVKELLPSYTPAQGDNVMLVLQDFAYREMLLREHIQTQVEGSFLSTARAEQLDHLAETIYGIYRLQGSKPYTTATLALSKPLDYDVIVPKGYQLTEDGGIYFSHTLNDAKIPKGQTSVSVTIELSIDIASHSVHTDIPVTPLPYLSITQNGDFVNGGDKESDTELKERIRTSHSDKSTAGSAAAYKSYTLRADERIDDVLVFSPSPGVVKVVYYSETMDSIMQERITNAINDKEVRPLTDLVIVAAATEVVVDISATLITSKNVDTATVIASALSSLSALMQDMTIGKDFHVSLLTKSLMVEGVEHIELQSPTTRAIATNEQVIVLGAQNITTRSSTDVY